MKLFYIFVLMLFAYGCGSTDTVVTDPDSPLEIGLLENQSILVAGQERDFHLYIPQNPTNASIVLLFHGNRSTNDEILGIDRSLLNRDISAPYKVWLTLAEQENYPQWK